MIRRSGTVLGLAVFFLLSAGARAESPLPLHLFAGSDLGWSTVSPYAYPEGERSGVDFDLKLLGSAYVFRNWIVDLGGGWQYSQRSGENLNGGYSKVLTRGSFVETSVRYGHFTGWQFGPVFDFILVGDVGLGNGTLVESQAQNATLAGVQAFYEWPERNYRVRLGGRWMTDLNVENRSVNVYQASLEIGIPLSGGRSNRPHYVRRPGIEVIQKDRALKRIRLVLDARRIEFDYNRATLRPEAAARLARLGRFLVRAKGNWNHLQISGHTDERGTVEYNQRLSEDRAAAVKAALVGQGVPSSKMETRGYSELQPIDPGHNEAAWQRNRRVEFEFTGVQDLDLIVDGVNQATTEDSESGEYSP
jgi:outer membrane protein OmpA-like peptidoglycan-associated protein